MPSIPVSTANVIGLPVALTDYVGAVDWILEKATLADQAYAFEAANTHVAALARKDQRFGAAIRKFDFIAPDGMPLVWAANAQLPQDQRLKDRIYGPTLMLKTIEATHRQSSSCSHFLLGGKQETLEKLENTFTQQYPNATIAGTYSPPFGTWPDDENQQIFRKIRESGATLIWVGLGCPKQEQWIAENKTELPPGVYFGIGAAFAFHAGEVKQAPSFFQKNGLEWAYRLAMEPKRLFKRYCIYNSLFLYYLAKDKLR